MEFEACIGCCHLQTTKLNDVFFRNSSFRNIFESQLLKYFLYLNLVIVLKEAFFSIFVKRKMDFRRINRRSGELEDGLYESFILSSLYSIFFIIYISYLQMHLSF